MTLTVPITIAIYKSGDSDDIIVDGEGVIARGPTAEDAFANWAHEQRLRLSKLREALQNLILEDA